MHEPHSTDEPSLVATDAGLSRADPFDAGPYARLQAVLGLGRPAAPPVLRRSLILAAVAWVPLAVLAAIEGLALGDTPRESLLLDVSAYARYLIALPALVLAEPLCLTRLATIARHFSDGGLVSDADRPRYSAAITSSRELLCRRWAALSFVLLAYGATLAFTRVIYPVDLSTWIAPIRNGARALSLAGWWRVLVSQPLFLLIFAAWLWRIAIWSRFLRTVARLDLQLVSSHPDHVGGLHFVETSPRAFTLVAFAIGTAVAGGVAEAIIVDHRPPPEFTNVVLAVVGLVLILCAGPLLVFGRPLRSAWIHGVFVYGQLATALGRRFERRWLARRQTIDDEALSVPDFSATTDLYSVVANIRAMKLALVDPKSLGLLVVATLLPFLPVVLAIVPFREVLRFAAKLAT